MKEITGNLKQDVKDLLGESANLFTGFFKRGACTVRAVSDKWKDFARNISTAVDTLMKPPFAEDGTEAPTVELAPDAEPVVTVVESLEGSLPMGRQMTLSQANEEIRRLDMQHQEREWTVQPVKVKIDYLDLSGVTTVFDWRITTKSIKGQTVDAHYLPFKFAGKITAYTYTAQTQKTDAYSHSLFIADFAHNGSAATWNTLS